MDAPNPTPPTARPIRFRRGCLALIGVVLLLAAIVAVHKAWTAGAGKRLAKQVAEYRVRGEPIEPDDFNVGVGLPDEENAALDLRAASMAIDRSTSAWKMFDEAREGLALPMRPEELSNVRALIDGNPRVFPLVESATRKAKFDWGVRFKTPVIATLLPDLAQQRELARFLAADALLAHTDGDDARAIRRVREILFIARGIDTQQPMLVGHLTSIGLTNLSIQTLGQIVEDLRVGDGPRDATPEQLREVIAQLLDEALANDAQRRALIGERMMQLDVAQAIANGKMTVGGMPPNAAASVLGALIRPTALGDARLMIRHTTAVRDAFDQSPTWPAYKAIAPPFPDDVHKRQWRHMTAAMLLPALDRAVETHFRGLTERRMAATLLALRWYAAEHGGSTPQSLDPLVPKYLPAVPADAFAPTAQPLKYLAGADPVVYSVGVNGVDDGGSAQQPANRSAYQPGRWDMLDATMRIKREPRPTPEVDDDAAEAGLEPATGPTTLPSI